MNELFQILLDGITLQDGTHIEGYELVKFSALPLSDGLIDPNKLLEAIKKLDVTRPWENVI